MSDYPITDPELIAAIADRSQQQAWYEFERLYAPALLSSLRRRGFSFSDAEDCCQRIFAKLIQVTDRFEDDGRPASFRRWLYRLARNESVSYLREQTRYPKTLGFSGLLRQVNKSLGNLASSQSTTDHIEDFANQIDQEYRRNSFLEAAAVVQAEVSSKQWQAFWRTMVEPQPTHQVAKALGMSIGAVYVAKGRVLKRIQVLIQSWEEPT